MKLGKLVGKASFVRELLEGRVELESIENYPLLSEGRVQQIDDLLSRIRLDTEEISGVERLRHWDLVNRPIAWPTPLLTRVIRQVGATDASAALSAIAHLALGVRLIRAFGTDAQLRDFENTPKALASFALTEQSPGSDVSRIQTYAEPTEGGFVLNGTKHWVTNGACATHFVVVARTAPPRAADKPKLSAFLVRAQPGIEVVPVRSDVLTGSAVAQVTFTNIHLSKRDLLGTLGKGFRVVVAGLSEARLLVGAAVLGACIRAFNDTVSRVVQRRAFGRMVGKFPSVQSLISEMLAEILAMESLVHAVAGLAEPGSTVDPVERGIVRLAVSTGSGRVLDAVIGLHGAAAFAGDMKAARHWADTRALTLLDGSDLALESYVILEGTRDIRERLARLMNGQDVLARMDAAASHFARRAKNSWRRKASDSPQELKATLLYDFAEQLGAAVESTIREHGVELVEKQHTHSRLASILVDLSTWSALLARVQTEIRRSGEVGSRRMIEVGSIWVEGAAKRVQAALTALDENDDIRRDRVAARAYTDKSYPFDVF